MQHRLVPLKIIFNSVKLTNFYDRKITESTQNRSTQTTLIGLQFKSSDQVPDLETVLVSVFTSIEQIVKYSSKVQPWEVVGLQQSQLDQTSSVSRVCV